MVWLETFFRRGAIQLVQVTILLSLALLADRLLKNRAVAFSYVIWLACLIKCVTPPVISSPLGIFSWTNVRLVTTGSTGPVEQSFSPLSSEFAAAIPSWLVVGSFAIWLIPVVLLATVFLRRFSQIRQAIRGSQPAEGHPLVRSMIIELTTQLGLKRRPRVVIVRGGLRPAVLGHVPARVHVPTGARAALLRSCIWS